MIKEEKQMSVKMSSIPNLKEFIQKKTLQHQFVGKDEDGNPIYDESKELPSLDVVGTVKLHGTSAGICFDVENNKIVPMSKKNILTIESDNYGFAKWFYEELIPSDEKYQSLLDTFDTIQFFSTGVGYAIQMANAKYIVLHGEWAGKGIQKGVGISNLEKDFFLFGVKVYSDEENYIWLPPTLVVQHIKAKRLFKNIFDYKTYPMKLDLNNPEDFIKSAKEALSEVENECPVATSHIEKLEDGQNKNGEGLVFWTVCDPVKPFKLKDERFVKLRRNKKKEKTPRVFSKEEIELAESLAPDWRIAQAFQEVYGENWEKQVSMNEFPDILRWVLEDINKEEKITLEESGINLKKVKPLIVEKIKDTIFSF